MITTKIDDLDMNDDMYPSVQKNCEKNAHFSAQPVAHFVNRIADVLEEYCMDYHNNS